ncbi:heavy-metal-associated domain-containing protein [Thermoflexibacter ruber]|uniref:Copper chaperone CopZ n=1 Tax=Thermoflexibacter ruber TaxID=1003 RepID=A0A1I2JDX7_9BACT|nr:heavy metal-associated domain-containing protein [Thermoflexibacter ruber]SFF52180.1 Copper chaperone CopZ [Thermoflexibacter ruber]
MKFIQLFVLACLFWATTASFAFSQTVSTNQTTENLKTTTVKVKGITCATDLKTIATNVEKVKGVNSCKPLKQGATSTFEVKYNPALVSEKEIFNVIENTGGCENPTEKPYKIKQ